MATLERSSTAAAPAGPAQHPVVAHFELALKTRHFEDSLSMIAIKALLRAIAASSASTMMGLHDELKGAQAALKVRGQQPS